MKASELTASVARYYHTLRPLRAEQILFRPVELLRRGVYGRFPGLGALHGRARGEFPARPLFVLDPSRPLSARARARIAEVKRGRLSFVGETGPSFDWSGAAGRSRLWNYNLFYLEWLLPLALGGEGELVRSALAGFHEAHPIGAGPAWEPYPAAVRTVALAYLATIAGADLEPSLPDQIAAHASFVSWNLERHLLGNHLLRDRKALALAYGFLGDRRAAAAFASLADELERQVLADGGHFERSPMYHALALADAREAAAAASTLGFADSADRLRALATRMADFLAAILHPDGEIPCFADSGLGVAPEPRALLEGTWEGLLGLEPAGALPAPPSGFHALQASGLFVAREPGRTVLIDAGELGAPYLPGHGHSDALSYELSVGGERVVVDRGVHTYTPGATRDEDRGGCAHNSVTVDGEGPDELWLSFRAARRSRILSARIEPWRGGAGWRFQGAVRSYRGWTHERRIFGIPGAVAVVDRVDRDGAVTSVRTFRPELVRGSGFEREADVACIELGRPQPCACLRARFDRRTAYVLAERPDASIEDPAGDHPTLVIEGQRIELA